MTGHLKSESYKIGLKRFLKRPFYFSYKLDFLLLMLLKAWTSLLVPSGEPYGIHAYRARFCGVFGGRGQGLASPTMYWREIEVLVES